MPTFRERFETQMTEWLNSGKSETEVFPIEYDRLRAYFWGTSTKTKIEKFSSEDIISFGKANYQALGSDNFEKMLRMREHCSACGERYKLENLSSCIECPNVYCFRCQKKSCSCGGELVG